MEKKETTNLEIKTELQLKYLKLVVGAIILIMIVVALTFYGTFHLTVSTAQLGRYAEAELNEVLSRLNWVLIVECVVFVLIGGFLGLKLTHKFAGALDRVEKMIHEAAEKGGTEEIKVPEDDELHDLVDGINNLIKSPRR
jgi:hypothetical protein